MTTITIRVHRRWWFGVAFWVLLNLVRFGFVSSCRAASLLADHGLKVIMPKPALRRDG
jgi:hypothetical protein